MKAEEKTLRKAMSIEYCELTRFDYLDHPQESEMIYDAMRKFSKAQLIEFSKYLVIEFSTDDGITAEKYVEQFLKES